MAKAIVTLACGEFHSRMGELTHPLMATYARKVGAEFIVWRDFEGHTLPHYKKLELTSMLDRYERLIYLDTDILVRDDAPDLFQVVSPEVFGAFEEGRFTERQAAFEAFLVRLGWAPFTWDGRYFNTGVMVLSGCHRDLFQKPPVEVQHFYEQSYINALLAKRATPIHVLDYRLNRMSCMDQVTGESRLDSYFLHYAGVGASRSQEQQLDLMAADLREWQRAAPAYRFPRRLAMLVTGGLASQVAAEPTVRYLREVLYPAETDVVSVVSDFPEIFAHLRVNRYRHEDTAPSTTHRIFQTGRPGPVSPPELFHPVDAASTCALKRMLPLKDREIRLPREPYCGPPLNVSLRKLVLLHPGRETGAMEFPTDFWQACLDALVGAGHLVAIVGATGFQQGIVGLDRSKAIDLVDQLSIQQLFSLIGETPVLISNESGLVQIAGAYNGWIGLVSPMQHPDLILPYRRGGQYYKARVLQSEPVYEKVCLRPTDFGLFRVEEPLLRDCLPSPEAVVAFATECLAAG